MSASATTKKNYNAGKPHGDVFRDSALTVKELSVHSDNQISASVKSNQLKICKWNQSRLR